MNKDTLPRWDLSPIFSGFTSKAYKEAVKQVDQLTKEFLKRKLAPLSSAREIEERFYAFDTIQISYYSIFGYAELRLVTNTEDSEALEGMQRATQYQAAVAKCRALLYKELAMTDNLAILIDEHPQLHPLRYVLLSGAKQAAHLMDLESEDLAADLAQSGADGWSRLQEILTSQETIDWKTPKGVEDTSIEEGPKTIIQLRSMAIHPEELVRKEAYRLELELSKRHEKAMAMGINNIKKWNLTLNKRRGYNSYLEPSLEASRMEEKSLQVLITALEDFAPILRQYLRAKAKLLGKKQLPFYDLFAPVGTFSERWSWDRACNFIQEQYGRFYPAMGEFVEYVVANGWIDAPIVQGKVGGAFCYPMPKEQISRLLVNFDGYFGDVITLAHELGHGYHSWVLRDLPGELQEYSMPVAETASTFGELLVLEGAMEVLPKEEQLLLLDESLTGYTQILVDILSRYYFEESLFKRCAAKNLSPQELCSNMIEAQRRAYGDGLDMDYLHPYMWFNKGHYYSADLPFYNYPYAFGGLFSLGIYAKAKEHGPGFGPTYDALLRVTGSSSTEDVAKVMGADIQRPEFWQQSMSFIQEQVSRYIKLVG